MQSIAIKKSGSETAVYAVACIILSAFALSYALSFAWAVFAAMKTHADLVLHPFSPPASWHPENYLLAFTLLEVRGVNMFGMVVNSLWLVAGGATLNIMGGCLMAYAVTKFRFPGRGALIALNIVSMTLPIVGSLPSQFRVFSSLGMTDSPMILVSYFGGFGAINLYMCAFFRNLSWTYAEAAKMDGAGNYRILFGVMIPLAKGPIVALAVLQMIAVWNDYNTALVFMPTMPTLATGIYLFQQQASMLARMDILTAAVVLSALPPLVLYLVFNKTVLTNVSLGGIKE